MKMILQKHTSKFVVNLLNGLGITACVALTSCGDQDKSKQTENQVEKLKNGLMSKGLDEDEVKAIADWLNSNGKDSTYILEEKDLKEIFQNDSKLNEVAEKLGVKLTESDPEPDDEKKEINEWLNKLNSLNDDFFNDLDNDLKEKVAQKFIDNNIDITNDDDITTKLAGFINEVKDEKKQNEISIKVGGEGKVTITKVADSTPTDFVFDTIDVFEKFVGDLKGKEITGTEVSLSFGFEGKMVKICEHKTGFDLTGCFEKFLNCFKFLTEFKNLKVPNLTLGVSSEGISLNSVVCDDDFYKGSGFWNLVKDHAALFGITKENKFEIVKDGSEGSAVVKIGEFETTLKWSEVVVSENTLSKESGWGNIFTLKGEEQTVENVTVEFDAGKCTCKEIEEYKKGVELKDLATLEKLVKDLKNKKVTIGNSKNFSLAFNDNVVKVCGHASGFEVMKGSDFAALLKHIAALKGNGKAISSTFKIALTMNGAKVLFDEKEINSEFVATDGFWSAVHDNIDLFEVKSVFSITKASKKENVKVGNLETSLPLSTVCDGFDSDSPTFKDKWNSIFKK